jgi:hypothetical protein
MLFETVKRSSLFYRNVNDEEKKFYKIVTWLSNQKKERFKENDWWASAIKLFPAICTFQ